MLLLKFTCYLPTVLCVAPEPPAAFYVLLEKTENTSLFQDQKSLTALCKNRTMIEISKMVHQSHVVCIKKSFQIHFALKTKIQGYLFCINVLTKVFTLEATCSV